MLMRPPSVDNLARSLHHTGLAHPLLVEVSREAIRRYDFASETASEEDLVEFALGLARKRERRLFQPVINATGTLLHTNLGRAPWPHSQEAAYSNLEFDLASGKRGSRQRPVSELFALLTGAEAALIVNNCAAAVTLVTAALAQGSGVIVSRSELVEIGGGFRVPEVVQQSGAQLVEVGTTNRTRASDYLNAVDASLSGTGPRVAMALSVHQSNYKIVGFTEAPQVSELKDLGVPLVCDIGSGLLDAACPWLKDGPPSWLENEPAAKQTLQAGADLVCFSGDKLLGGPQAGIIAGKADLVARVAKHPLARAFRPGSLVLNALQNLALSYLARDGDAIAFWRMASRDTDGLVERAQKIVDALSLEYHASSLKVVEQDAVPGGGTLPTVTIPSAGLSLEGDHAKALRELDRPIVARVQDGQTVLDLRCVDSASDSYLIAALSAILARSR